MIEVSIVIPTLNEEGNVSRIYNIIDKVFESANLSYEIVFVDDNSQDSTVAEINSIENKNIKLVNSKERLGLGYALEQGMRASSGKYILFVDCDCSVEFDDITRLVQARQESTCIVGSRYIKGSRITGASKMKVLFSRILNIFVSFTLNLKISDISHSFRIFQKCDFNDLKIKTHPGFFWILSYELKLKGYDLKEVPIHFRERTVGVTKNITKRMLDSVYKSIAYLMKKKYFG